MNEKKVIEALELTRKLECQEISGNFTKIALLLEEALPPEPRFYKGQQVLVRKEGTQDEVKHILECIYPDGRNKYRTIDGRHWQYCKPDPGAKSLPHWIEHDGSEKKVPIKATEVLIWIHTNGCEALIAGGESGNALRADHEVARYAIIPLPEYVNE